MLFFILLALLQLTLAARPFTFRKYQKGCDAKIEDLPWQISNFVMFEKKPTAITAANHSSYLTFAFADINNRLELNTTCTRTLPVSSTASLNSDDWMVCESEDVRFMLDAGELQVSRYYKDDW